ncbi:hypothetical protein ACM9HF_06420 [Colwellia sp. RE-S-Sl-9]
MKLIILVATFLLSACTNHLSNSSLKIKEAMAYGTIIELNKTDNNINKELYIRLYQTPLNGEDCFIETHGICKYQYYVSVSTFDESPEVNVFKLGVYGEIINTQWLAVNQYDYAEIEVTYNSYTKEAIKNNKALNNVKSTVVLKVNLDGITEK